MAMRWASMIRVETNGKNMTVLGAKAIQTPMKSDNSDVFAGNITSLTRSTWKENACDEALIAAIDSLVIASELESISNEGEYEADCKDYGGIILLQCLIRAMRD